MMELSYESYFLSCICKILNNGWAVKFCFLLFQVDYPRFNLPKNVANLIYGQALVWLVAANTEHYYKSIQLFKSISWWPVIQYWSICHTNCRWLSTALVAKLMDSYTPTFVCSTLAHLVFRYSYTFCLLFGFFNNLATTHYCLPHMLDWMELYHINLYSHCF